MENLLNLGDRSLGLIIIVSAVIQCLYWFEITEVSGLWGLTTFGDIVIFGYFAIFKKLSEERQNKIMFLVRGLENAILSLLKSLKDLWGNISLGEIDTEAASEPAEDNGIEDDNNTIGEKLMAILQVVDEINNLTQRMADNNVMENGIP